jgi:hypothetical protein
MINNQKPLKEIVTVTEMAQMCNLSRARFYQLVSHEVFPSPSRNQDTGRPFFNRDQQEQCLLIRRCNKGANGKAVIFYGNRPLTVQKPTSKRKLFPISKSSMGKKNRDPVLSELQHGLAQLGMSNVTEQQIRRALTERYPDGHRDVESGELLAAVFGALQRQNSADKLRG